MSDKRSSLQCDPKFKSLILVESHLASFPTVKSFTKHLADKAIKENKRLSAVFKEETKQNIDGFFKI